MILENGEEIRDVKGYEGLYAVTNYGWVWSYPKDGSGGHGGKWLNPGRNKKGYYQVSFI
jgi:hypothetical protein